MAAGSGVVLEYGGDDVAAILLQRRAYGWRRAPCCCLQPTAPKSAHPQRLTPPSCAPILRCGSELSSLTLHAARSTPLCLYASLLELCPVHRSASAYVLCYEQGQADRLSSARRIESSEIIQSAVATGRRDVLMGGEACSGRDASAVSTSPGVAGSRLSSIAHRSASCTCILTLRSLLAATRSLLGAVQLCRNSLFDVERS